MLCSQSQKNFVPLPLTMNRLTRLFVWLRRAPHSRGFGIQSPTDYAFVRYVVSEHWPYYAYDELNQTGDGWLRQKLGRFYFRLANWRQPQVIVSSDYKNYWLAGCRRAIVRRDVDSSVELMHIDISLADGLIDRISPSLDNRSVVVVEGLWHNWALWHQLTADKRVRVTFDLYYCGLLLFDSKRTKQNYIINF